MVQLVAISVLIGIMATGITGLLRKSQSTYSQPQSYAQVVVSCDNSIDGSGTEDSFGFPWTFMQVKHDVCMGTQREFATPAFIADIIAWSVAAFVALTMVRKFA